MENQDLDVETTGTSRIFLLNDAALSGQENKNIVQLRHPSTGGPGMFLLSSDSAIVQEVQTFSDEFRSWFIDESVKSEGDIFISTPIDPLFLALPYFLQVKRCMPLDQVLTDEEYPEIIRLLAVLKSSSLKNIADSKGPETMNAWELNQGKLLLWLKTKTEKVANVLQSKGIHVGPTAVSNTFVKTQKDTSENYLKYAHGIISEYLTDDICKKLSESLGLPSEPDSKRKKQDAQDGKVTKRLKLESTECLESSENDINTSQYFKQSSTQKPTVCAKDKARTAAAKGTKSISSFFAKK